MNKSLTDLLDEIEQRAKRNVDCGTITIDQRILKQDVPTLVKALRYCQTEVIDNLPSIARKTFSDKLAQLLREPVEEKK